MAIESARAGTFPVALGVLFFYSYTKRFTSWSHLVLGFCLGMSPAAAWIAIAGSLDARMLILCAAVTLWVGGFDVLYACQDLEYDKSVKLFSVPKRFGVARALAIARAMHVLMIALLAWLAWSFHLPWPAWAGIVVVAGLLAYEHSLVSPNDLSRMNAAFFTVNGYISFCSCCSGARRSRSVAQRLVILSLAKGSLCDFVNCGCAADSHEIAKPAQRESLCYKNMSDLQINDERLKPDRRQSLAASA